MHQRTFTLAWALLSVAASFAATLPAYAADECLSGPKATTPAGQHWYYRIDRATKKQCWYLGEHGAKVNKMAASKPAATDTGTNETQTPPLEESVANARAELSSTSPFPPVSTTTPAPNAAISETEPESGASSPNDTSSQLTAHDLITQAPTTLASRLPLPNEFQPADSRTDQTALTAAAPSDDPQKQPSTAKNIEARIGPMQIFLCALAIGLALAALLGRVVLQYVTGMRRKQTAQNRRRQIWPEDFSNSQRQPSYAQMITPERRARAEHIERDASEIERLLRSGSQRLR